MPTSETGQTHTRILVVDDSAEGRSALARYLELNGFVVTAAADGTAALTQVLSGSPPDVIVTDLMLPDMDGREISRFARQLVPRPIVAMVTGWAFEPVADELESWGIDLLFYKPLDVRDFIQSLRTALAKRDKSD
jgi:CheY-like chemotaxis protein